MGSLCPCSIDSKKGQGSQGGGRLEPVDKPTAGSVMHTPHLTHQDLVPQSTLKDTITCTLSFTASGLCTHNKGGWVYIIMLKLTVTNMKFLLQ